MRRLRMLLVENDAVQRDKNVDVLQNRGWDVDTAENGKDALPKVRGHFDVIVLDLRMPEMSGEEFLEHIQDQEISIPPVIVLSAYLDDAARKRCAYLGASCVLKKPYDPDHLAKMAEAVASKVPPLVETEFDADLLDYMVKRREVALLRRLTQSAEDDRRFWRAAEPVLVVLRRWNSWYPSVFPVIGGAYAIVGPSGSAGRVPVVIIDPGFQFMKALMDTGIPWKDLDTCVITHNHPDHMGGIFELMAARHALRKQTRMLCNAGSISMLGDCTGFNMEMKELNSGFSDLLSAYESGNRWVRLRVSAFDTAHEEIGRQNSSKGLCVVCESGDSKAALEETAEVVLLGDTEYDRSQHKERLMALIGKPNVRIAVLHVGSSQLKQGTGKHLYLSGLKNILSDIDAQLSAVKYRGHLLVLVSEWGLEHATKNQITNVCGTSLASFNSFSPILETMRYVGRDLKKISLIPADIGLVLGMESGNVYLESGETVSPENCFVELTTNGLKYTRSQADSAGSA